jgi:hypothetical protein
MAEKPSWYPTICDKEYCKRLRQEYPEYDKDSDDEELIDYFNEGRKYEILWDHIGDAYEEYEPLADAFLKQQALLDKAAEIIEGYVAVAELAVLLNPKLPPAKVGSLTDCARAWLKKVGRGSDEMS